MTAATASTTTVNLIAFAEDPATVPRLRDRFATFAEKHSCRAIFLDATRAGDGSEDMVLGVAGMPAEELRSTVHDLLAAGTTSALFWAGRDLSDPRFEALASLGATVVVDSSRAADGKLPFKNLPLSALQRIASCAISPICDFFRGKIWSRSFSTTRIWRASFRASPVWRSLAVPSPRPTISPAGSPAGYTGNRAGETSLQRGRRHHQR